MRIKSTVSFARAYFGLDSGSFGSPLLLSFKLQYPGPNRPANVAAPNEVRAILRRKSVSWLHPLHARAFSQFI